MSAAAVARPAARWTRRQTVALSRWRCAECHGIGLVEAGPRLEGQRVPCGCVLREIFRRCQRKFAEIEAVGPSLGSDRRAEEFRADFVLLALRALGRRRDMLVLFRMYVMVGAGWEKCAARMGVNRGQFWHAVYRMERLLGRVYREAGLYPCDEYFLRVRQ